MTHAVGFDRIGECSADGVLSDQFIETAWPIATCDNDVAVVTTDVRVGYLSGRGTGT